MSIKVKKLTLAGTIATATLFASTIVASILYQLIICGELVVRKTTFSSMTMNTKTLLSKRGKH